MYKKPFEFLNLGILAYLGNGKALSQVRGRQGWAGLGIAAGSSESGAGVGQCSASEALRCHAAAASQARWPCTNWWCSCFAWLAQVEAFEQTLKLYGDVAFFLWRSVYITKQVGGRLRGRQGMGAGWQVVAGQKLKPGEGGGDCICIAAQSAMLSKLPALVEK